MRKAYARKIKYLARVHDGGTCEIATGYWLLAVEDANRVIRQEFGLEQFRVMEWLRVQGLMPLAGAAYSF